MTSTPWIDPANQRVIHSTSSANCSVWRARPTTNSRGRRARRTCVCSASSTSYLKCPCYGSRKMAVVLDANRKCIQRLIALLSIEAQILSGTGAAQRRVTRSTRTCCARHFQPGLEHRYIFPMRGGCCYLVAIMDWFRSLRTQLGTLQPRWKPAFAWGHSMPGFRLGQPEIWNSDQGSQFAAGRLPRAAQEAQHPDQHGWTCRALDSVFIESNACGYPGDFAIGLALWPGAGQKPGELIRGSTPPNIEIRSKKITEVADFTSVVWNTPLSLIVLPHCK